MPFPPVVATGPLALAALSYWRSSIDANVNLNLGLLSGAVELIEHLHDLAETAPPAVRARCASVLPRLLTALDRAARESFP